MSWMNRLTNLLRSRELSKGLDEELRFHLDSRIRDNIKAGMTPEEARRDAARRFGNQTLAKERTRDMDILAPVENIGRDLVYALRGLRKSPGFAAVAVFTIALGAGANTAVFTVLNGVLLRPLPFPNPEQLFLISHKPAHGPFESDPGLSDRHYVEFHRQARSFERTASFAPNSVSLIGAGEPVRLPAALVTADFFPLLRLNPAIGRTFTDEEDQPGRNHVAVLSDNLWRARFGADPRVVGTSITLDGVSHAVIGIMPSGFTFPYSAALWTPLAVKLDPGNSFLRPAVGRLKPGMSPDNAQAELEAFVAGLPVDSRNHDREMTTRILPLKELLVGKTRKSLLIFAGAVAFVLLIACANVANLLLMRAAARRQEMAVRAVLGAGRWRLIRQLLTESTLISLAGGTVGILVALWGVPALLALAPAGKIPRVAEIHIDGWVLAFTFGVSVLTGIVFGLAPAFDATRRELRESLSQGGRTATARREALRSALVVAEISFALVLLTGAGLMLKSFLRILAVDPGFRSENVLTATVDLPNSVYRSAAQIKAFYDRALTNLSSLPGVRTVAAVNWRPLGQGLIRGDFVLEGGRQLPRNYIVDKPCVSSGYFRAMGIRLLAGREFTENDGPNNPGVVIVSESVARRIWPGEDPLGKRISMADRPKPEDWLSVVGVVNDVRQQGLTEAPHPAIYQSYKQVASTDFLRHMTFILKTASSPYSAAPAMRAALRDVDRDQPVQAIASMEDALSTASAEPRFQTRLLAVFALLALALSAIGIYGVLAYSVRERTHEIGIRMALGAETGDVMRMVIRRSLALAAAGVALGAAGALAVTRVLTKLLFEVTPTDPGAFASAAALLAAVALLAALLPARRAARLDPLVALRYE